MFKILQLQLQALVNLKATCNKHTLQNLNGNSDLTFSNQ